MTPFVYSADFFVDMYRLCVLHIFGTFFQLFEKLWFCFGVYSDVIYPRFYGVLNFFEKWCYGELEVGHGILQSM